MSDYISREAFIQQLQEKYEYLPKEIFFPGMKTALEIARELPAADVREVRRGKWLTKEYMYGDPGVGIEDVWVDRLAEASDYYAYCSECGKDAGYNGEGTLILSEFCPNCGADMEEGQA